MEENVIILGKRSNPYPYIKTCDIYVQPSRYEGKSVTVREAQMLCKPVVVTNYPTAKSQINDGVDGVIVPMDNEGCAEGIVAFIQDVKKQPEIVNYLNVKGTVLYVDSAHALAKPREWSTWIYCGTHLFHNGSRPVLVLYGERSIVASS